MARKLIVEIIGDSTKLTRSFNQSTTAANKFGAEVSGSMGKAEKSFTKLQRVAAGGFVGAAALSAGIVALRKVVDAAAESEQVLGQTQVALESTGKTWEQYGSTIERAVAEQSKMGFDDEALFRTFSLFVRNAGSVDEALRRNNIAMDVARARFIDLEQAAALVNKAALGQAGALRRIGIDARNGASGVELLAQLERDFAGSAEQASGTATAAQERLQVSLENVQEAIGSKLTPAVSDMANALSDAADIATTLGDRLRALGAIEIPTIEIPFTTVEVPGTGSRVGDIAKDLGKRTLEGAVPAQFREGVRFLKLLIPEPPVNIDEAAAKRWDEFFAPFTDAILGGADKAVAKARDKTSKAFGGKDFKPIDNEVGESLQRAFDATLDALDLKFDRASFAKNTSGALAILDEIEQTIRKRITTEGRTTELLRQLFEVGQKRAGIFDDLAAQREQARQDRIDAAKDAKQAAADAKREAAEAAREAAETQRRAREAARQALQARQFRALGLAPGGGPVIPGVENLKKQFQQLTARADIGDLPRKLATQVERAGKVLAGAFGKVTVETREAAAGIIDAARDELNKDITEGRPFTKAVGLNKNKILEGLGLTPEMEAAVRGRLAGFNSAGQRLGRQPGAVGAFGMGFTPAGQPINITTEVILDGERVGRSVTRHQGKQKRSNPRQKRGPMSGI